MFSRNKNLVRMNIGLPKEIMEKVIDIANMKGITRTQLILMAVSNYIDQREVIEYTPRLIELLKKEQEKEIEELTKDKK